jgi:hypothetical protein
MRLVVVACPASMIEDAVGEHVGATVLVFWDRGGEDGEQVVAGRVGALVDLRGKEGEHLGDRLAGARDELGFLPTREALAELQHSLAQPVVPVRRHAEDLENDRKRERSGELGHEIHLAVGRHRVEQLGSAGFDHAAEAIDVARREQALEVAANPAMPLAVEADKPAREHLPDRLR